MALLSLLLPLFESILEKPGMRWLLIFASRAALLLARLLPTAELLYNLVLEAASSGLFALAKLCYF